jgi:DEAD/DEAH box helicase domain-containing protein
MRNLAFDFSGNRGDFMVLDVETLRLADEVVGGWTNVEGFGVAVVVTWDEAHDMRTWFEEDVPRLLEEATRFNPIVTFNGENFDFRVLSALGNVDYLKRHSADLLVAISRKTGFRVKLDSLAKATLGRGKSGAGIDSVQWWREGQRQKVIDYCKMDVELTRDLYRFAKENRYLLIDDLKTGQTRRVEMSL